MADANAIKTELDGDPLGRGYSGMDDGAVVVSLNTENRSVNKTNMSRIKIITKSETTGQARGKRVNVFNDPFVEFGGKLTGGLRIRECQSQTAPADDFDDSPPYWS